MRKDNGSIIGLTYQLIKDSHKPFWTVMLLFRCMKGREDKRITEMSYTVIESISSYTKYKIQEANITVICYSAG